MVGLDRGKPRRNRLERLQVRPECPQDQINLTLLKSTLAPDMTADKGIQIFTYAVYAWNGSLAESGVVKEAYDLNVPAWSLQGAVDGPTSLFSLDAENIVIEAIKPAEDGSSNVVVRLYEAMHMKRTAS